MPRANRITRALLITFLVVLLIVRYAVQQYFRDAVKEALHHARQPHSS